MGDIMKTKAQLEKEFKDYKKYVKDIIKDYESMKVENATFKSDLMIARTALSDVIDLCHLGIDQADDDIKMFFRMIVTSNLTTLNWIEEK